MAEIRWINKNIIVYIDTQKWLKMVVSAFCNSHKKRCEAVNLSSVCRQQFYRVLGSTTPAFAPYKSALLCL